MKIRYLLLALTAAALLPVLGGCGGGSEEATAQTKMPPAKYAHKADLICEEAGNEQSVKAAVYLEQHESAKEADLVVPAGIPPLEKEVTELRELGLPKGREEQAEVFLDQVEKSLQALTEEPDRALSEKTNPYKKANELGEKLGLGDCSRNP
jgi:hypothetical protein